MKRRSFCMLLTVAFGGLAAASGDVGTYSGVYFYNFEYAVLTPAGTKDRWCISGDMTAADVLAWVLGLLISLIAFYLVVADRAAGPRPYNQETFNAAIGLVMVVGFNCVLAIALFGICILILLLVRKFQAHAFSRFQLVRLVTSCAVIVADAILMAGLRMPHT